MSRWLTVAAEHDIPPGHAARLSIAERPVAIFNVDGEFHAIDDTCSHAEASLSEGELDVSACSIECPLHGSCFDLRSGEPLTLPAVEAVLVHQVRVENGKILVAVTEA